jgi:uncharacterized protein (DUF1800 family)
MTPSTRHRALPDSVPCGVDRRRWLAGAGSVALAACAGPIGLTGCAPMATRSTGGPAAVPADDAALYHAVNRITWGATPSLMAEVRRQGYVRWVDAQLDPARPDPLPPAVQSRIDALQVSRVPMLALVQRIEADRRAGTALPTEAERDAANRQFQQSMTVAAREAASRHLWRALYARQSLREQLVWFWFNHFNVHQFKANLRPMLADYEERAIRPHVLGRFRDLLGAVVRHPAMLRYLDNDQNAANRINENFARELMELHTLGVDGGYEQADVQALARVLTGLGVSFSDATPRLKPEWVPLYVRDGAFEFNPARHDMGPKTLLGRTVAGRGMAEVDEVLDLLAAHPSTARFVSRRLATFFLSDQPPPALVERMAASFTSSGGRIDATLRVLLLSPEFVAAGTSTSAKFKDPVHFVVSAVRASSEDGALVLGTAPLQGWLNQLGQGLYNRQTPDGYPLTAAAWTSAGQMSQRLDLARTIAFTVNNPNAPLYRDDPTPPPVTVAGAAAAGMAMAGASASAAASTSAAPAVPRAPASMAPPPAIAEAPLPPVVPMSGPPTPAVSLRPLQPLAPPLSAGTEAVLAQARTPQERHALLLAAPEFMFR